ncbi:hypothetical protein DSM3645_23346 [Blastopirellula marina DSM 3645]|uniref:Uncharacterized protein n=1 Tax=Blastopirellula marina DSM 3645 TaxID=314230 RepID=A3ZPS8_9BACT|nr:hypothetical protein DSM3645_23346 [Blastopirellula marina DSM 3645]
MISMREMKTPTHLELVVVISLEEQLAHFSFHA